MLNPYSPPQTELQDPKERQVARPVSVLGRVFAVLLAIVALFLLFVAAFGAIEEYRVDGYRLEEVLALVLLLSSSALWLRSALLLWRGRPRAWLWVLAPIAVVAGLFALLLLWELSFGLP